MLCSFTATSYHAAVDGSKLITAHEGGVDVNDASGTRKVIVRQ